MVPTRVGMPSLFLLRCRDRTEEVSYVLFKAMRDLMESSTTISSDEIELELSVPGAVHAVFVDLPGG